MKEEEVFSEPEEEEENEKTDKSNDELKKKPDETPQNEANEDKTEKLFDGLTGKLPKMNTNQEAIMENVMGMNNGMSNIELNQRMSNSRIFKTINENN